MAVYNGLNNAFAADYNGTNKVSKNLIIGGEFGINPWQRGTTFTSIPTATYSADRFRVDYVTSATTTISKSTTVPTPTQAAIYTTHSLSMAVTGTDASIASSDFYTIGQRIEGYNYSNIAQRAFTLSFWVYAFQAGIYCVSFVNSGGDRSYVAEYTISVSNTWQKITVTVPASPSAGTWNYTNGVGLSVYFTQACGSTFQTTANSWNTGLFYGTSNQVNNLSSASNTFLINLIQVESGTVATPFEQRLVSSVLADCQRYYYKNFPQGTTPAQNTGAVLGALAYRSTLADVNSNGQYLVFPVTMNAAPTTITTYNPAATNANWRNSTTTADSGVPSLASTGDAGVYVINPQVIGDGAAHAMTLFVTAEAEI